MPNRRRLELYGAAQALGPHRGTFRLTNEAVEQPAVDLPAALAAPGIAPGRLTVLRTGEMPAPARSCNDLARQRS